MTQYYIILWFAPADGEKMNQGPYYASGRNTVTTQGEYGNPFDIHEVPGIIQGWLNHSHVAKVEIHAAKG